MKRSLLISMWAVAALAAGCGGGGGSSGDAPAPTPASPPPAGTFDLQAAWKNFLQGNGVHTWTVSGTASDHQTYTLTLTTTPGLAQVFPVTGTSYATSDVTVGFGVGGLGINSTTTRNFYDPTAFTVAGTRTTINSQPATCSVSTAASVPPASAALNASGTLESFNDLNGCVPSSTATGTSSTTAWSLQNDATATAGTLNLFCQVTTVKSGSTVTETDSVCVEVAADGTLGSRAWVRIAQGSFTFTGKTATY